ncbi:MAG TPA: D-2-hydroxyacid dehydrogenase family protein [Herpetosiphonaceae bacterium]|nr:D-2-hydroxyacid dehydrogenase family protein [Herpetosiphonaceae bacterium]
MKLRCAILDDYQQVGLTMADWSPLAYAVDVTAFPDHFGDEASLVEAISDCEIVVIMRERTPFRAALFARLPRLKLLITTGMRNGAIDLAAAAAHGVVVCGTASGSEPPAELTWALILGLARQLVPENQALRTNGSWQSTIGMDLKGSRLGILGLGKIGSQVAWVGQAFGMEVLAWSPHLTAERAATAGVELAESKAALLERSDIVTIHMVLSERTRELIGAEDLRRMQATAYLINTSRAGLVDQAALLDALRQGWIAGAGLDVFDLEPLPPDAPLRRLPNVLATPHLGYVSQSNYRRYFREAVEDIQAFLNGTPLRRIG